MKLHIAKGRDFDLENHLEFFVYVKACDEVKTDKLFEILRSECIPNLLLKTQRNLLWKQNKNKRSIIRHTDSQTVRQSDKAAVCHPRYSTFA